MLINLSNSSTDEETLKQVLKLLRLNIETVAGLGPVEGDSTENEADHDNHWLGIMTELTKAKTICQTKLDDFQCTLHEDDDFDVLLGRCQSRILNYLYSFNPKHLHLVILSPSLVVI